jgi:hypothetical protein
MDLKAVTVDGFWRPGRGRQKIHQTRKILQEDRLGQKIHQGMGLSGRGYERERETAEGGKRWRPGAPGGAGGRALVTEIQGQGVRIVPVPGN